ncbi:hypothetical protein GH714_017900 [Hevea brasiliensis]|uniref:Uncharacterized protein n=1 Tax=Hevea brasiliensis TaxID=3981 RepID=A0A6A6NI52_HEVBR|nr:hypothetical protein GH714_017900 [Hevea brasiliensis]
MSQARPLFIPLPLLLLHFAAQAPQLLGSYPIFQRSQNGYEYNLFSDEKEEVDSETCYYTEPREKDHLVADIIHGSDSLVFLSNTSIAQRTQNHVQEFVNSRQPVEGEDDDSGYINQELENRKADKNFNGDERFFIFAPTQFESKKLQVPGKDDEEIFGDLCTVGSTSKSSSEWRSSIKDSGTEDPFSSSSRRTCPSGNPTQCSKNSLKSIQVCPRSISDRIVHKITTINKKPSDIRQNPYHELEAAYVARICLTWEALNWNYKNFHSKRASQRDFYPGCPGHIGQQFQQFQVLLQRYIENEPYEQGRRPEVYARMRLLAPKLLLVPEYRDSEDDAKEEGFGSRISSAAFLMIMEEGIRTFMNFLKADKQKPCQILTSFFRRNLRDQLILLFSS